MTEQRDFRKFRRFGLNGYEEIVEQPNGEFVCDEDYLEACDEIDRLRKFDEGKALTIRALEIAQDEFKKENESLRARVKELEVELEYAKNLANKGYWCPSCHASMEDMPSKHWCDHCGQRVSVPEEVCDGFMNDLNWWEKPTPKEGEECQKP